MSSPLDARDREILEHLHQSAGGDIQALCELLGVTRTAVRQRISRLEGAGMIAAEPDAGASASSVPRDFRRSARAG